MIQIVINFIRYTDVSFPQREQEPAIQLNISCMFLTSTWVYVLVSRACNFGSYKMFGSTWHSVHSLKFERLSEPNSQKRRRKELFVWHSWTACLILDCYSMLYKLGSFTYLWANCPPYNGYFRSSYDVIVTNILQNVPYTSKVFHTFLKSSTLF